MVMSNDCLDMTIVVDWDIKQQTKIYIVKDSQHKCTVSYTLANRFAI